MNQKENANALFSMREETLNALTHGIGFLLSIAGLCLLAVFAARGGTAWHIVGCSIFGASLVLLYLSSTLYHSFHAGKAKNFFRLLDHSCIYILIAGTYTPFTLSLRGGWGWTLFGLEWGLAISGIVFKSIWRYRYDAIATSGYLVMGWLIIMAIDPMLATVPSPGIIWLIAGGCCYTLGVPFYFKDEKIPYFHTIWHLFVLAGSICHFFAVLWYVIPDTPA